MPIIPTAPVSIGMDTVSTRIPVDPAAASRSPGSETESGGPECGGGIMERDHRNRSRHCSALALALVCLELTAQVLCLSMFPSSGSVTGLGMTIGRADSRNDAISVGSASSPLRRFLRELFDAPQPGRAEPDDEDQEQSDWPQIELIVRQSAPASPPPSLTSSAPRWSLHRVRTSHRATPSCSVAERSIPLCRLTC